MTNQTKIAFTKYRETLKAYERHLNVNYHACVGQKEKEFWAEIACRYFNQLVDVTCCKADLVARAERCFDRSTELVAKIRGIG